MKKKNIVYFVDDIETSFVINDIKQMANKFDKVILMSIDKIDKKEGLPINVHSIDEFMDWRAYKKVNIVLLNIVSLVLIYLNECFKKKAVLPFKRAIALMASNIFKASEVKRHLNNLNLEFKDIELFYSFWFYDCIYLAWLKKKNPLIKIVTRTHSGDLYEEHISIRDNVLMRNFQLRYINAVFPVSKMGTSYLKNLYPEFTAKFQTIYLGTKDYNCMNPFEASNVVMVSCASFRHHKRIHKIAEALLYVKSNVTWLHFGNENLNTNDPKIPEYLTNKAALLLKPNINYVSMGLTENENLMDFYAKNSVSFFISLSAAEGIPVSMMEAISFGIPVLSTDVGGCAEIVNEYTGKLIPLETDLRTIAEWIDGFHLSKMNTEGFRQNVRQFWEQNFDIEVNYSKLFDKINSEDES